MDIARPDLKRRKRRQRIVLAAVVCLATVAVSVAVTRFEYPVPTVSADEVALGTAQRGDVSHALDVECTVVTRTEHETLMHGRVATETGAVVPAGPVSFQVGQRVWTASVQPPGAGEATGEVAFVVESEAGDFPNGAPLFGALIPRTSHAVTYIPRPGFGRSNTTADIFKVDPAGAFANRTAIAFGVAGTDRIEVVSGLAPGDRVILSDMSHWPDRIRIKWPEKPHQLIK